MAGAVVLDLPARRDSHPRRRAKLVHRVNAGVIEARLELLTYPGDVWVVGEAQLAYQRLRPDSSVKRRTPCSGDPKIDETSAQMPLVDPVRDAAIVALGYKQRYRECAKYSLDGSLPLRFIRHHLDELARKRHLLALDAQIVAQHLP